MRKVIGFIFLFLAVSILAACGGGGKNAEDVLSEAVEASKKLESYSTEMKMTIEGMGIEMTMEGKGDFTRNPETVYLELELGMTGMSMNMETYVVDGDIYLGAIGEWVMLSEEESGIDIYNKLNDEDLENLLDHVDQFELTEEGKMYVLTLSSEGKEAEELLVPYLEASFGDLGMASGTAEQVFDDLTIDKFEMTVTIDKKTMVFQSQSVEANFDIDGESYKIISESTVSNVNKVEPVTIPDEVKENAHTY